MPGDWKRIKDLEQQQREDQERIQALEASLVEARDQLRIIERIDAIAEHMGIVVLSRDAGVWSAAADGAPVSAATLPKVIAALHAEVMS